MRRLIMLLTLVLAALLLAACEEDEAGDVTNEGDIVLEAGEEDAAPEEEELDPNDTGPIFYEITGEELVDRARNASMWSILTEQAGFTITISSGVNDPVIELYNIPYDIEAASYPIDAETVEGIWAAVNHTPDEDSRYVSTEGMLTFTEVGDTLAGTFEFEAVRVAADEAEPLEEAATADQPTLQVEGRFSEIDRPDTDVEDD